MKKTLIAMFAGLFLLTGCSAAKLQDGTEAVVMFNEGNINAETLYESLKEKYGIEALVKLIDTDLLEREYDKTNEEEDYINNYVKSVKTTIKNSGYDTETYLTYYYNVKNISELKDLFRLTYRRNQWMKDYAKTVVTDKEIKTYYNDVTIGDIDLAWILISSKAASTDDSDKKNEAEANALKVAKEVVKRLDKGEAFTNLAKEYSDDTATKEKGGNVGKVNRGDIADNLIEEAIKLEKGKYSKTPIKTTEGYAILYVNDKDEKPELDTVKDKIIETISSEIISNDNGTLYLESLEALRSKYSMTFKDTDLSNDYTEYLKKQKAQIKTSSSNK